MDLIKVTNTNSEDFNKAFEILDYSFPEDEKITKKELIKLISLNKSELFVAKKDKTIVGFINSQPVNKYYFIGYLAINKDYRGQGIGSQIMSTFMKDKKVILEVEKPTNKETKNRIHFYKKLGLVLNEFNFIMPRLRPDTKMLELNLMTKEPLTKKEFNKIRDAIHLQIYETEPIYKLS